MRVSGSPIEWTKTRRVPGGIQNVVDSHHMKSLTKTSLACIVVAAALGLSTPLHATDTEQDKKDVQRVLERYLESVKTADLSLASTIWLQTPDIVAVTPFGRFQGWDSVRNDLYIKFLRDGFTERTLQAENVAIRVMGNAAWLVSDWTLTGTLSNGQTLNSKGWETHVYERVGRNWRISHLHYSSPPPRP